MDSNAILVRVHDGEICPQAILILKKLKKFIF